MRFELIKNRKSTIWLLLIGWIGFWAFGWWLNCTAADYPVADCGYVPIAGYDSGAYLAFFREFHHAFGFIFRHPLFNLISLPIFAMGATVTQIAGSRVADFFIIGAFAFIGAVNLSLIYLLTKRWISVVIWLTFGYTWIVSALPETYSLSTCLLLLTLLCVQHGVRSAWTWTALSVASGGVTVTNGLKPLLVYFMTGQKERKRVILWVACAAVLVFALMSLKWTLFNATPFFTVRLPQLWRECTAPMESSMAVLPRLRAIWQLFILEPMIPHGNVIGVEKMGLSYATIWPHLWGAMLMVVSVVSAWINRCNPVVKALLLMLSVDFILHLILGWGIDEGQIYSPHWIFAIPVLIGTRET